MSSKKSEPGAVATGSFVKRGFTRLPWLPVTKLTRSLSLPVLTYRVLTLVALAVVAATFLFERGQAHGSNGNQPSRTSQLSSTLLTDRLSSGLVSRFLNSPLMASTVRSPLMTYSAQVTLVVDTESGADLRNCTSFVTGDCSLAGAIGLANEWGGAVDIEFDRGRNYSIDSPLPEIRSGLILTIDGTAQGGPARIRRRMQVEAGARVTLNNLIMENGSFTSEGGCILNNGIMVLSNSTVRQCGGASLGGGIFNRGTLLVKGSSIEGNVTAYTSIARSGGGIFNAGDLTLDSSTVSNNYAPRGGGITNDSAGLLFVINSTISSNKALTDYDTNPRGGGIYNDGTVYITNSTLTMNRTEGGSYHYGPSSTGGGIQNNGTVYARNSIISGNDSPTYLGTHYGRIGPDISGVLTSQGYNLIGNTDGVTINGNTTGNILNKDAQLEGLNYNGGNTLTLTHTPAPGSPARNAGNNNLAFTPDNQPILLDQRGPGYPRIRATVDMGAVETNDALVVDNDTDLGVLNACTSELFDCSLRGAILAANSSASPDVILFDETVFKTAPVIRLGSQLVIANNRMGETWIEGRGLTLSGQNMSRIFWVEPNSLIKLYNVTLTEGVVSNNDSGGCIANRGFMLIQGSTISGCRSGNGGAIDNARGSITLINSTISGNWAQGGTTVAGGGAITVGTMQSSADLTLINSTIVRNNVDDGYGGGINNLSGRVYARNSLIFGNGARYGPDFYGQLISQGYNLVGDTARLDSIGDNNGNLFNWNESEVQLGPLQDNGGFTRTHALGLYSAARNAGSNALAVDLNSSPLLADQRGFPRIVGGTVDIGAYEQGAQKITVTTHAPANAVYQQSFTVAASASSTLPVTYSSSGSCVNAGPVFTMTSGTGTCTVRYDQAGDNGTGAAEPVVEAVTAQKANQTITINTHAPANATHGTTFQVGAMPTSNLPITFSSSGACTNTGLNFTMISGSGTCMVKYDQQGDLNYNPAPQVVEIVTALKANQTISVNPPAPANAPFKSNFTVAATSSSGLPVSYSSAGGCTNIGPIFTMTTGTGTCTVTYDQAGDSNYNAAPRVSESVTAQKTNQTITIGNHAPASAVHNSTFTVDATGPAGPVSYSSEGVCTNVGRVFTMTSGTGTCTVKYDQSGDGNYNAATQITESVAAAKANQTITVVTHGPSTSAYNSTFTVAAISSSGLPVSFSSAGVCTNVGPVFTMISGTGTCTVKYDQSGDGNYNPATQITELVSAAKVNQTISVGTHAPSTAVYNSTFTVAATSSSGLAVSYSSTGVCTNVGPVFTMTSGTGGCTVKYDQSGDDNYNPATQITESVTAAKADQTISVGTHAPASATYNSTLTVAATSSSGLAVSYNSAGVCTNVGPVFTMTSGTGTCTVKYDQAGDSNYNSAPQVTEAVTAEKIIQTIMVVTHAPANAAYNTSFTVAATSDFGFAVSYSSSGSCTNVGDTFTMTASTGICTVKYDQAGDANYKSAPQVTESVTAQKAGQTITVGTNAPSGAVYNTSFTVAATSNSGLAVSYSSSGACTNVGATFTMTSGTGTCTVNYDQPGNNNYNAAPRVSESVTAQKADQTITVSTHAPASALNNASFTVAATSSIGFPISYISEGSCINLGATFTMTSSTGLCTVKYDQAGDDNYNAAQVIEHVRGVVTYVVDNTTDDGGLSVCTSNPDDCSLRGAIAKANFPGNVTIEFDSTVFSTPQTITLGGSELTIANDGAVSSLIINGRSVVTVSGDSQSRVFQINGGTDATLNGLTITGGSTAGTSLNGDGGGILNNGTLSLINSTVSGNSARGGGGISNRGIRLNVTSSTISGNFTLAGGRGGGGFSGGGISNANGTVNLTNSTISGNVSTGSGGGIFSVNVGTTLNLINSTVSANSSGGAGGGVVTNWVVNIGNSIIAGNTAPSAPDISGSLRSQGHNLIGNMNGGALTDDLTGNILNQDARLGPLQGNGGPTQTHALLSDSPAINAGNNALAVDLDSKPLATDQRGIGFPRIKDGTVDIGAFESGKHNQSITVGTHAPASSGYNSSFTVSASSSSGLPVSYSSSGVCTNVGPVFTMTSGTGTCTVKYDQAGDGSYNPATQVTESVTAEKINRAITVVTHAPSSAAYNSNFTVAATAMSGSVSYSSAGVCTNVGPVFTMTSGTGTCTVKYDQAGDGNYNQATQVTESVTAEKINQAITVVTHAPSSAAYNSSFTVAATATSGPVSYSSAGVCTNVGSVFTMTSGTGTCTVKYNQAGDSNHNSATQIVESVSGQRANQAITVNTSAPPNATYNSSFTVSASSNSGLAVSYSGAGACTNNGAVFTMTSNTGTCTVKYDQAGDDNYNAAIQVTETVQAKNTPPTITPAIGLPRQEGSASSNSTIATVNDTDSGPGAVTVTVTSANPSNGVTISNITNSNGTITADIVADCGATDASFTLQAGDGIDTTIAILNISVTANSLPVLSYANPAAINIGGSTTVNPATGPSDNGTIQSVAVQSQEAFAGSVSVDSGGAVSISNAAPAGAHTITIRATDNCGATTDATFELIVGDPLLISELRTSGPNGPADEFVEIYNNSDVEVTVPASGYGLFKMGADCNAAPILIGTILPRTVIPARGHFLFVGAQYSLSNYPSGNDGVLETTATGDATLNADIETDANIGLFTTADITQISSANRLDAVGFALNTGGTCDLLSEGATLPSVLGNELTQHSYFRKMCDWIQGQGCTVPGIPKDTNNNSNDFWLADTAGISGRLGAPGPENLTSPIRRDNTNNAGSGGIDMFLLSRNVSAASHPNRSRNPSEGAGSTPTQFGTMTLRYRVVNNTGAPVTRLRYRIVDSSTAVQRPGSTADLRAITGSDESIGSIQDSATCTAGGSALPSCTVTVKATTLETPSAQATGGGYNSTLSSGTVTLARPLTTTGTTQSILISFKVGIQKTGTFRFYIIVEALP